MNPSLSNPISENIFVGDSEMAVLMRSLDWSQTPLGSVSDWAQSLKTSVSILLNSRYPMFVWWGHEYANLYNDAYRPIMGANKHPQFLGQSAKDCWAEVWDVVGPLADSVLTTGQPTWSENLLLIMERNGYTEETYFTFSYSPIHDESGGIGGIFCAVIETTKQMIGERRLQTLRELSANTAAAKTVDAACHLALATLSANPHDIPFALLYLVDSDGKQARLVGTTTNLEPGTIASPPQVDLTHDLTQGTDFWTLSRVKQTEAVTQIEHLTMRFAGLPGGAWSEPSNAALVMPLAKSGQAHQLAGFLVVGVSPRRVLDDEYRGFFDLVSSHVTTAIANANAYEAERKRAEALAALDQAKTTFFSNVSHEFRTPLTLMLNPLEEVLANSAGLFPTDREQLEIAYRNSQRLLKLVNTLLDFSRIEAGRIEAVYQPTDLALLTTDLAGVFRSAIERAGIQLRVECSSAEYSSAEYSSLQQPVYVDREMWEKIVLNLLSNAFKFTFEGEIAVILRSFADHIALEVRDTGTGIPSEELPYIFERFHRVKGARGRSYEGSGIGLSLVQELVRLHGGTIEVSSILNQGTCFTVSIPLGSAHLPGDRLQHTEPEPLRPSRTLASTATGAQPYVEEALHWLPTESDSAEFAAVSSQLEGLSSQLEDLPQPTTLKLQALNFNPQTAQTAQTARILLVDDNADMRNYVKRLLSQHYEVEAVTDGVVALIAIRQQMPDLVVTDVMMPELDGFELLRQLRADPQTQELPIILLSARAGEEARIEGLAAGADDYLTKPFSARELLARVEANLKLAQLRRQAMQQQQVLRLEAETAKQKTEAAYENINQILGCMTDAFVAFDRQWRYTYANPAALHLLQKSAEALIGRQVWQEVFPEKVGGIAYQELHRAMEAQSSVLWEEWDERLQQWLEVRAYPSSEGITVYFQNISDRKQAEAEREELLAREQAAREAAEAANRIKDEFLAVVSHELRSPLNPILGWSKLLQNGKLDQTKTEQALATIERNARLQAELIEDLLDVSRILRGKLSLTTSPVNLAAMIRAAIETVRLAAEAKSIQIETELEWEGGQVSGEAIVLGDATRLQQVVWNLLSNAVKFTPPGGQVTVQLAQSGDHAQITIADTGKGISPDFMPYVFEYFRQADSSTTRKFGGLGLGLAIVRHLVELHGGTIQADSPGEGLGATFTVKLPLLPTQPAVKQNSLSLDSTLNLQGIQILVVDDDADTRDFVAFVLEEAGATVIAVASAHEAITALTQSQPDILLSDIGMPEMDGYMLMRQIRALSPEQGGQIKAIALTAYAGEMDYKQAMAAGFQQHITKPIEPQTLIRVISDMIHKTILP